MAEWKVGICKSCQFVYLLNPPEYGSLMDDYAWEKTYQEKSTATQGSTAFSPLFRWIKNNVHYFGRDRTSNYRCWFTDGKVLDVGCGAGMRIPEPMIPYGIELSTVLHASADAHMRKRGGYCVLGPGAEAIWKFRTDQFDGILMHSYLEHESQFLRVLEGAFKALKSSGKIFVRAPNFGSINRRIIGSTWCGFRHPDHVNYFTVDALRKAATKTGFILQVTNSITLPIDDNIYALLTPRTD